MGLNCCTLLNIKQFTICVQCNPEYLTSLLYTTDVAVIQKTVLHSKTNQEKISHWLRLSHK